MKCIQFNRLLFIIVFYYHFIFLLKRLFQYMCKCNWECFTYWCALRLFLFISPEWTVLNTLIYWLLYGYSFTFFTHFYSSRMRINMRANQITFVFVFFFFVFSRIHQSIFSTLLNYTNITQFFSKAKPNWRSLICCLIWYFACVYILSLNDQLHRQSFISPFPLSLLLFKWPYNKFFIAWSIAS